MRFQSLLMLIHDPTCVAVRLRLIKPSNVPIPAMVKDYFMPDPEPSISDRASINRTVEAVIRIGVIAGLIGWCFVIARPFLIPIIWGAPSSRSPFFTVMSG
jgi:hypothetical protein